MDIHSPAVSDRFIRSAPTFCRKRSHLRVSIEDTPAKIPVLCHATDFSNISFSRSGNTRNNCTVAVTVAVTVTYPSGPILRWARVQATIKGERGEQQWPNPSVSLALLLVTQAGSPPSQRPQKLPMSSSLPLEVTLPLIKYHSAQIHTLLPRQDDNRVATYS